jgi:hypothetical protein
MKNFTSIALLLALCNLVGCTAPYKPPEGASTAMLIGNRGQASVTFGGAQVYTAFADESCKETQGPLGSFNLGGADRFETKIAAGQRIYIRALTMGARYPYSVSCMNVVSLIPEAGATYTITQILAKGRCATEISDMRSNTTPASYLFHHDVAVGCKTN